jgi:flagellar biosynthesis protein FlhF
MQVHRFIADSAADAVAQIRAELGPQAVVLNVRPLPGEGLSRLWQKRRIEVLACLPDRADSAPAESSQIPTSTVPEPGPLTNNIGGAEPVLESEGPISATTAWVAPGKEYVRFSPGIAPSPGPSSGWRLGNFLETSGMLPVHAHRVVEDLRTRHGDLPPPNLGRELDLAGALLRDSWKKTQRAGSLAGAHVLVGAPGVGKTVCLCKWLAQTVLLEGRGASVWRLDGRGANTAEALSVYAEILGVPVERSLPTGSSPATDLLLIDLPGVNWNEPGALGQLNRQIQMLANPQIHLVLNASYETSLLLAQVRAFSVLPISDLIMTHLDEEARWGKLWNVVLGTKFSISFLSAGQNIPGSWTQASAELILARQFPGK